MLAITSLNILHLSVFVLVNNEYREVKTSRIDVIRILDGCEYFLCIGIWTNGEMIRMRRNKWICENFKRKKRFDQKMVAIRNEITWTAYWYFFLNESSSKRFFGKPFFSSFLYWIWTKLKIFSCCNQFSSI